jgi:hypothetical protein
MCIKHHTHSSVESVEERGATVPSLSQCVVQVDGLNLNSAHALTRVSRIEDTLRDGLKTCCSETSTAQNIIYNINRSVWNSCRPVKTPRQSCPGVPLPVPRSQRKNIHNPPKNVSPSNFPSPVYPGIDSNDSPDPRTQVHRCMN